MKKLLLSAIVALGLTTTSSAQSFFEGFEGAALPTGWDTLNLSGPTPGTVEAWFPSNVFSSPPPAIEGGLYFASNYEVVGGSDTISSWLFTPVALLKNGDQFMFYSRTLASPVLYPDRMEVRLSGAGAGINAGTGPNTVGTYTMLLGVINPGLTISGYPTTFTKYVYTLSGLPAGGVTGRFAFRYFVEDAGPSGNNSDAIGVDSVYYQPVIATSISSAVNNGAFKVFPNPTSGLVKMNFKTVSDDREVIVQNLTGQILFREKVSRLENAIDLSNLSKGVYLLNIKQNGVVYTEKLTIE
jgi:hypothetical protein